MSTTTTFETLPHKDLISVAHLTGPEIESIFKTAAELKANRDATVFYAVLRKHRDKLDW